ncbi:hypothetical protein FWK35_00031839, partial [Aphis craccivora]
KTRLASAGILYDKVENLVKRNIEALINNSNRSVYVNKEDNYLFNDGNLKKLSELGY